MGRIRTAEDRQTDRLRSKYGIDLEQKREMIRFQGGGCAICGIKDSTTFVVDHDHTTEINRGILCASCNSLLGFARDNPEILLAAARYLNKHQTRK